MVRSRSVRLLFILAMSLLVAMPLPTHPAVAATHASATTVSGTVTPGALTTTWKKNIGSITLEGYMQPTTLTGGISGKGYVAGEWTVFANGAGQFSETMTIFGSVLGRTGAYVQQNVGTTKRDGSFEARGMIVEGIGGLAGLHGTFTIRPINATSASYTGQVSFNPS
jgi:hypothetical protein